MANRKLGKHEPRHNPRLQPLAKYLSLSTLPEPPADVSWLRPIGPLGAMGNNAAGNCTIACAGHMIQSWTASADPAPTILPDVDIIAGYVAVTGIEGAAYNPQTGANDNGCNVQDVLGYWRDYGIGGHKIQSWLSVSPVDEHEQAIGHWLLGGLYLGAALPLLAETQIEHGQPWDVQHRHSRNTQPGSWGGHAIPVERIRPGWKTVITWGVEQDYSTAWGEAYVDEVYVILSGQDWINQVSQRAPSGFDLDQLLDDLRLLPAA